MTALKVIGIVLLLLWAVSLLLVGGIVKYSEAGLYVQLRIGILKFTIIPIRKRKKKPQKREGGSRQPKGQKEEQQEKGGTLDLVKELMPLLLDTANRFRKKVRLAPLELLIGIPGGDDPAGAALRYGQANALLGMLWQPLNQAFHIRDGRIGTRVEFEAKEFDLYLNAGVSLTVGQAAWIGIRFGAVGLSKYLKYQSEKRKAV